MTIVGYVGKLLSDGMGCNREYRSRRELTDWKGNRLGTCFLSSSWRVNTYVGSRMYQIYATVDGVEYTGRGFGENMSVNLRPCVTRVMS